MKMENNEYDLFMLNYNEQHKLCPNCGSVKHTTSLLNEVLDMDNKHEYEDLNKCECVDCGHIHTRHDRISKKSFANLKIKIKKMFNFK
jgi:hypothetical protein